MRARVAASLLATAAAGSMREPAIGADMTVYLDGPLWSASSASGSLIGASVPGDLVTDILGSSISPASSPWLDLTWRVHAGLWDLDTWTYTTTFVTPASLPATMWLVLDGVKLAADISLNGAPVGSATDTHTRYALSVSSLLAPAGQANTLNITFPPTVADTRNNNGRFTGCSGGWDWAPYSNETTGRTPWPGQGNAIVGTQGIRTFSKGIWQSVYLAGMSTAAITAVKPLVWYTGAYPTAPLTDATAAGWRVDVVVYVTPTSPGGASGSITVTPAWAPSSPVTLPYSGLPVGQSTALNVSLTIAPGTIQLWWPNTLSTQRPMYGLNVTLTPSAGAGPAITVSRSIGFRTVALVTDDDSNPASLAGLTGSGNLTMRLKVNGANLFVRGANFIPLEATEGKNTAEAHWVAVKSAADAGMNMLRVWGGGTWPLTPFLDACDAYGILLYVDAMYASQADSHHFATPGNEEETEIRYNLQRMAAHPSIALYDACNECGGSGAFVSFVAPTMASEDPSRPIWPASPSAGWADGVDRLWGLPKAGTTLAIIDSKQPVGPCTAQGCNCTQQANARYFGFPLTSFNTPQPVSSAAECCTWCSNTTGCYVATYNAQGCQLLAKPSVPVYQPGTTALFPPSVPLSDIPAVPVQNKVEQHGPYQGGGGWPTVNGGGPPVNGYPAELPPSLMPMAASGPSAAGTFTSEFGVGQIASFELMAPTLSPTYWSMHGGHHPQDNCTGGFAHVCSGGNVMAQRNYGCDDAWATYFPAGSFISLTLDDVGAVPFAGQLYLCQIATMLKLKSYVEWHRSENMWGLLTWQLGEVWGTYGWGSLEYSSGTGSVTGGRWKPSHYMLTAAYQDVFTACGVDGRCFVKNDNALAPFSGSVVRTLVRLTDGAVMPLSTAPLSLPAGANAFSWGCADGKGTAPTCNAWPAVLPGAGCAANGTDCVLVSTIKDGSGNAVGSPNMQLLARPGLLNLPSPAVQVTASVGSVQPDGTTPVTVITTGPALFVTLFTQANGRFSDNTLFMPAAGSTTLSFIPFSPGQEGLLATSLRVDHLQKY